MRCSQFFCRRCSLHATTFYVTVAGLGGEPEYEQRFTGLAKEIEKLVKAPDQPIS